MNKPLRRVVISVFVLFALLFANLNYIQYIRANELRTDPQNRRVLLYEYSRQRGSIVVEGTAIATSHETDGKLKYLRTYPAGDLYAHVTGYKSLLYPSRGIESAEEGVLSGQDDRLFVRRISDMLTGREAKGGNVVLTLDREVQKASFDALAGRKGAVISLDPRSGEILSLVSGPTYNPDPLASHDENAAQKAWKQYADAESKPMLNRALRETYPPGSTFKVVMSALALENGVSPDTVVDAPDAYTPPQTSNAIENFNKRSCGSGSATLEYFLQESCNTPFAKLGNQYGADAIRQKAEEFGFAVEDQTCPLSVVPSRMGQMADPPAVAQSAIGQRDVRMTPLQGAMLAAAVANNGTVMKPYLVSEIQAPDISVLDKNRPEEYKKPLSSEHAEQLRSMMNKVVSSGTGTQAQVSGVVVGGKTGTAEDGDVRQDHEWFIGYALRDGTPIAAVAVVLENAGTSSADAASVAARVIQKISEER